MSNLEEDPLLTLKREDTERAKLLDEALIEVSLFNLRLEESVKGKSNEVNTDPVDSKNSDSQINEEFGLSNGIKFFNEEFFECSFTEELLFQKFLKTNTAISQQFGSVDSLNQILDVLSNHNQSHSTWSGPVFKDVMQFCFQLLGTYQSKDMLHNISFCIIKTLNNQKFSPLKLIAKLLPSVIQNMGGNVAGVQLGLIKLESSLSLLNTDDSSEMVASKTKKQNEMDSDVSGKLSTEEAMELDACKTIRSNTTDQAQLNFSEPIEHISNSTKTRKLIDIVSNFKSIVIILSKVLFKEFEVKKHSNIPDYKLDEIFILVLKAAQDPLILSSHILFHIKNCLQLILEKYTDDVYFRDVRVQDFVEKLYLYWEDNISVFDHPLACRVLTGLIPISVKGQRIRSSLALLSIICCLSEDEVEVRDEVSISYLADFCINKAALIKVQNVPKIYSIMLLIDVAIDKPLRDDQEKHQLSRLLEMVNSIQVAVSSTDSNKMKLDCLIKVLSAGWRRLLNPPRQRPMKQRTMNDFVSHEFSVY